MPRVSLPRPLGFSGALVLGIPSIGALLVLGATLLSLAAPAQGSRPRRGASVPAPAGAETAITLSAVGDVMFGRYGLKGSYRPFWPDDPFGGVKHLLSGRDISFCNLETPIAVKPFRKPYRGLTFRADPKSAGLLKDAGFTVAVTANNHSFDQDDKGVRETLSHLSAAGLGATGTGVTREAAFAPHIFEKNGVKVGVMGVTLLRNFTPKERVGFDAFVHLREAQKVLPERVRAIRSQVDFLVLSIHFGVEYYQTVSRYDRTLMDRLQAEGVDVVIGHHTHMLRPVEHRGSMVVFYSMGNFFFDYEKLTTGNAGVAQLELVLHGRRRGASKASHREIRNVRFVPIFRHWRRVPMPATGARAKKIRNELVRITNRAGFGTRFVEDGESLRILPPE